MCDLINYCKFDDVIVFDPHSPVSSALINNCTIITNELLVKEAFKHYTGYYPNDKGYYIVSPDSGAYKKVFKLADKLNLSDSIVLCNKARNLSDGKILAYTVDKDDLGGKDCFLCDDIIDGGGTFELIGAELRKRNCGRLYLIVSHGIFSKGVEALSNIFDGIYCSDSFNIISHPKVIHSKLMEHFFPYITTKSSRDLITSN